MENYDELTNRIAKRFTHLKKWAKRNSINCFRIYNKDLGNFPLILDWYDGDALVWLYNRKKDETDAQKEQFKENAIASIYSALNIPEKALHIKQRRRQTGLSSQYEKNSHQEYRKIIQEGNLKFEVNLSDYLDSGLFLDHRNTRNMFRKMAEGKRILNLFAYTGSFTCYAIDGGATSTTSVDMNKNYGEWIKRNLALNGFDHRKSDRVITDNCLSFIKLEAARNRYDLIICDPPTFSNSKNMKTTFSIDKDYPDLLKSCIKLLSPSGTLIFSTNSRNFSLDAAKLPPKVQLDSLTHKTVPEDFKSQKSHQCWMINLR
ncbi:oxidoreductase [Candidatus Marinamargulisbacteria bacterium SCGC AG-343-D04]|nr:oxidoreductase [Candidatus Marinamargulisbacteria bacterium SCGC AG-343-D04]